MVTVFVTVMMVGLLVVAGLVIDGGRMLAARREAYNVAESAARAGVQGVDEDAARRSGGVQIAPGLARRRAQDYLTATGYDGTVDIQGNVVVVTVVIRRPLFILGIAGMADAAVTGHGSARGARGITEEGD